MAKDDDSQPVTRPDLQALEGGGETSEPGKDRPKVTDDKKTDSPNKLADSEENGGASTQHENQVGGGYKDPGLQKLTEIQPSVRGVVSFAKKNRAKLLIGGALASFITLILIGFFLLLPFKILHIVNDLQSKMFATTNNAMDKETDKLFSDFVAKQIRFARLGHCGKTIDSSCNPFTAGDSLVTRLYRGWINGRLEEKMASGTNGVEIRFNKVNGRYALRSKGGGVELDLQDNFVSGQSTLDDVLATEGSFGPATRSEVRQAVRQAFENETRAKKVMYYIKVGKLLETKYGIKRCIVGCKIKDNFADWKTDKKRAAKMFLAQRVLIPRLDMYQLLYTCILSDTCNPDDFTNLKPSDYSADATGCKSGCDINGEALTPSDHQVRDDILKKLLAAYGGDVNSLRADYAAFKNSGIIGLIRTKTIAKDGAQSRGRQALGKLLATDAVQQTINTAQDVVPIYGEINMAATIVNGVDTMRVAIPKMVYVMNSTAAAQFFAMYRTNADEVKEGNVDAGIEGSFNDSLGPGVQIDSSQTDQVGGLAEAENTPLYQSIIGNTQANTKFSTPIAQFLNPTVYAAAPSYTCSKNSPLPPGKLVCDEEKVHQKGNVIAQSLANLTGSQTWSLLSSAASQWRNAKNGIIGPIFGALGELVSTVCKAINFIIPDLCDAVQNAGKQAVGLVSGWISKGLLGAIQFVLDNVLGFNINMISNRMSGGRAFDMLAAGADVSGNEFSHNGLGGKTLSSSEIAAINQQETNKKIAQYSSESFIARMFDPNNDNSFISKLAMSLPTNKDTFMKQSLASMIASPFRLASGTISSILSLGHAGAVAPPTQVIDDPFGITQYGYPVNDPVFKEDPETFWQNHCAGPNSLTTAYNKYAAAHPDDTFTGTNTAPDNSATGVALKTAYPDGTGTNGCLLIQAAAGSAGALFTNDVLSPAEATAFAQYKSIIASNQKSNSNSNFAFVGMGLAP